MTNKMTTFTKQAKERWDGISKAEQQKLIEELKTKAVGSAVIEIDKHCKAQIVSVIFGMDISLRTEKRYLFLSDMPPAEPESE